MAKRQRIPDKRAARKPVIDSPTPALPDVAQSEPREPVKESVPAHSSDSLAVVGLGGSTGSVKPLEKFFKAMPADSGMAFVVVLQLSPEEERALPRRLQSCTAMPIVRAENGRGLEKNTIYLVPEGKGVTSADGVLRVWKVTPDNDTGVKLDLFLRSLAESHGPRATAIVLSGVTADGALGIRHIKERGGLTIVQDPNEAEHRQMPVASIATGMVDRVLEVAKMPAQILEYRARAKRIKVSLLPPAPLPTPADETESALDEVLSLLRQRTDREFSYFKRGTVLRRIAHRMQIHGVDDLPGYLLLLRSHPAERGALVQDLLIPATSFFRDRDSFGVLQEHLAQLFKEKTPNDGVRIWVPACASGEEAYSIGMIALECAWKQEVAPRIQVFGCDPDDSAIVAARRGVYPKTIAADVGAQRLRTFFTEERRGYRVRRDLRELVTFASHDLLMDAPFLRMDLVSCRNLLVYVNLEAQKRLLDIFHFALNPNGLLFLGDSESIRENDSRFCKVDERHPVYRRRPGKRLLLPPLNATGALLRALEEKPQSTWAAVERSRAAEALRRSEEKYRTLFESVDQGFCIIQVLFDDEDKPVDYRFIEVNPAFRRHTGLAEAAGRRIREFVPSLEEHWFQMFGRIALTGEPARFQGPADQLGRYYDVYGFRIGDPTERQVAVVFNDITQRRRTELNTQFLVELDGALTQLTLADEIEQQVTERVAEFLRVYHCYFGQLKDQRATEAREFPVRNMRQSARADQVLRQCISAEDVDSILGGAPIVISDVDLDERTTLLAPKFHQIHMAAFVATPGLIAGKWFGLFVVASDKPRSWREDEIQLLREVAGRVFPLIERARAEEALRTSEERLRLVVENARDYAIFSLDLQRRITAWHRGAEAILGYSEREILGQSGDIIFTTEDREAGAPEQEAHRALTQGRSSDERWHCRKDGSQFWGSGVMMPMRNVTGEAIGFVKIFRDETAELRAKQALENALKETERARAEAENANKAKDNFLAVLSHELRTPLTPVIMAVRALSHRKDLPPQVLEGLEMIERNVDVESHLIEDLLDLTRIGRGSRQVARQPMDLHDALRGAVEISKPDIEAKKQRLIIRLQASEHRVNGDFTRLQQVFWNLLKNASKFTPERGEIRVRTRNEPRRIIVEVSDTGIGIQAEALPRIFDPFVQADENVARRFGGLGLGLALSKATVDGHGGAIRGHSPGPGRGATFTVELPLLGR